MVISINSLKRFFYILLIFLAVGIFSIAFSTLTGGSPCVIYFSIGIPCPSCGITRAILSFMLGNLNEALAYHPLFWFVALVPLLALLNPLSKKLNKIYVAMAIVFMLVWVLRMLVMFPHTEPMVINEDSLFLRLFK